jgi:hypothetical protein
MTEMTNESSAGPSVWERDLWALLSSQLEAEHELLESYATASAESPSRALHYLIGLLADDEARHNRIITDLAESLEADTRGGNDAVIPPIDFDRTNHDPVIDLTEQLLAKELEDAHELKRLKRELRDVKDTSLWSLLVDLIERDTAKHIAILRFVKKHSGPGRR